MLNNSIALEAIQQEINVPGIFFENEYKFTKKQITDFYEVNERTIDRYLEQYGEELKKNGYEVLKGVKLQDFMENYSKFVNDIDVVHKKTRNLGIFNFKSLLNIGMLLTDSEKAKMVRAMMLDIVLDVINKRTGGNTKYINQRDEDYIDSCFTEENYRNEFTKALNDCVVPGKFKFPNYTGKIKISIFKEKASEYKKILKLEKKIKLEKLFILKY